MYSVRAMRSACTMALSCGSVSLLTIVAVFLSVGLTVVSQPLAAQPACSSPAADPDGDGYGWENNATCLTSGSSGGGSSANNRATVVNGVPVCSSNVFDDNGDGWGWENNQSCIFNGSGAGDSGNNSSVNAVAAPAFSGVPTCSSNVFDDNGDGWGWENNQSCRFGSSSNQSGSTTQTTQTGSASGTPVCLSVTSDTDSDGYGFENGSSCIVTSASGSSAAATSVITPGEAPPPVAAAVPGFQGGHPICLTDASDAGNNGFGFENNRTCVVVNGVTATRNSPLLNQRSCIWWLEIGYGNYKLQNNVWNYTAVHNNDWSQCIELTGGPGNYVAKWDYNWLDRSQGNDFAVKSYPQVYYGRKTQYNLSGSVAETGLPVDIRNMPQFTVEYDYSETGTVERNVALESFFHNSCQAEEHNKQFEMMVWVGVPTIRTPGTLATTVTLSGQEWDVYTNPALSWSYVAFVAKQPSNRGTLNWNEFVYWSRDVGASFGVPYMNPNSCMGAIEIGTETFWGTGTFSLNRFRVNRR